MDRGIPVAFQAGVGNSAAFQAAVGIHAAFQVEAGIPDSDGVAFQAGLCILRVSAARGASAPPLSLCGSPHALD